MPTQADTHALPADRQLRRDLRTVARFVEVYCHGRHPDALKRAFWLPKWDVVAMIGRCPRLCDACRRLLAHAFVKRIHCPMDPKPACKHCPTHCYHPAHRETIRQVMKYAGPRLILRGRLDYLYHMFF